MVKKFFFRTERILLLLVLFGAGGFSSQAQNGTSPILSSTQARPPMVPAGNNPVPTAAPAPMVTPAPESVAGAKAADIPQDTTAAFLAITNMESLDTIRKLNVGDRVIYRVVEDREDMRELFISDTGDIEVPYLGRQPAAGKTCKELALFLKSALEKDLYYQATVIISVSNMGGSRGKVYVTGYVRGAGEQDIPPNVIYTVSKAIMRAGGFGDFADQRKVKIHRRQIGKDGKPKPVEDTEPIIVDVKEIIENGRVDKDVVVQPDDYIFVPQKLINL
jgi:protein involved in polysaccharide export with SLBB domain